jgi:hypothetical protein
VLVGKLQGPESSNGFDFFETYKTSAAYVGFIRAQGDPRASQKMTVPVPGTTGSPFGSRAARRVLHAL